jgi:hypothetical protein
MGMQSPVAEYLNYGSASHPEFKMQVQIQTQVQASAPALSAATSSALLIDGAGGDEHERCCGWFDSSYELSQGAEVTEELDASVLQLWVWATGPAATRH